MSFSLISPFLFFIFAVMATSVSGDSPGELFTQILSLLFSDDARGYRSTGKAPPSSSTSTSWCRRSSHRRSITLPTFNTSRQSPEPMETSPDTHTEAPELGVEAEPQDKLLLRLLGSFIDLLCVCTETNASSTPNESGAYSSNNSRQMFREIWDWKFQCGRTGDPEDEQPLRRRRCKRFATVAVNTSTGASIPSSSHYRSSSLLSLSHHKQENRFAIAKAFAEAEGTAGGLKSLLTSLLKESSETEEEDKEEESGSPPKREPEAGALSEEAGEFEDN